MQRSTVQVSLAALMLGHSALVGCSDGPSVGPTTSELAVASQALSFDERVARCADDPRVVAGLVSETICAGAAVFFEETFDGNGRTCGSCHPAENNTTLDVAFVAALHEADPSDPLFVAEIDPELRELETFDLLSQAGILENVDGSSDPTRRFVSRTVPHVLSLATSLRPDPADGTANPPSQRTGWDGDGSPDGTLRGFLQGAIEQHFTRTLQRRPGIDFRLPSADEASAAEAFQLSLGRQNELDLNRVVLFDAGADAGRRAFLDPARGRCNFCHANAGANAQDSGLNRNFDTGTRNTGALTRGDFADVGFGGRDLRLPNFDSDGDGVADAFGDGSFNAPPLIEAADTPPFFHNAIEINSKGIVDIDNAVTFYANVAFTSSVAARQLEERFGTPLSLTAEDAANISRFLRAINAVLNVDIAAQRLEAASTLASRFADERADVQQKLLGLARVEIEDALDDLHAGSGGFYPLAVEAILAARTSLDAGLAAAAAGERLTRTDEARSSLAGARGELGSSIEFQLGQGNLMY